MLVHHHCRIVGNGRFLLQDRPGHPEIPPHADISYRVTQIVSCFVPHFAGGQGRWTHGHGRVHAERAPSYTGPLNSLR